MIAWGEIIDLTMSVFERVKLKDIAHQFSFSSASSISRIKSGQTPSFTAEEYYSNIFDPDKGFNSDSNGGRKEKSVAVLFKNLEDVISIQFINIKENMSDSWFDFENNTLSEEEAEIKYKQFVMTMLYRAKNLKKQSVDKSAKVSNENADASVSGQNAASKSLISSPYESIQTSPETDSPSVITAAITGQKSIDPKHHTCYYCKNWYKVDKETDMQVKVKKCCKINKDTYYTDGHDCRDYDPHTIIIEISKKLPNPIGL